MITLLALAWAEEDWRAARDWAACQRELIARGERLDRGVLEPFISPGRNLANKPFLADLWNYSVQPTSGIAIFRLERANITKSPLLTTMPWFSEHPAKSSPTVPTIWQARMTDLPAWQAFYSVHTRQAGLAAAPETAQPDSAHEIISALERFRPVLDQVAQASATMPNGVILPPADPEDNGIGTIFQGVRRIDQTLSLRASAHLELGQSAAAIRDVELILWLRQATTSQPPLWFSQTVGLSELQLALQPIWEGLAMRRWTMANLIRLQSLLQEIDLLARFQQAMRGERILMIGIADDWIRGRYTLQEFMGNTDSVWDWLTFHSPEAWKVQSKVNFCWFMQDHVLVWTDLENRRIDTQAILVAAKLLQKLAAPPVRASQLALAQTIPGMLVSIDRTTDIQSAVDEAIVACALERYALDHGGGYPAGLAELTPPYLDLVPAGIVDGAQMYYQRLTGGRYLLSVRLPNVPEYTPEYRQSAAAVEDGRLVWRYPAPPTRPQLPRPGDGPPS